MTLEEICKDSRFSELKTVTQMRGKHADERKEIVGFQMWFDGKQFQAHSITMLALVVADYISGPPVHAEEWLGTEF